MIQPPPLVRPRPAADSEIPGGARKFRKAVLAADWHAEALTYQGWGPGRGAESPWLLRATLLLRMWRADERAVAWWETAWPVPPGVDIPVPPRTVRPVTGPVPVALPPEPPDTPVSWKAGHGAIWRAGWLPLGTLHHGRGFLHPDGSTAGMLTLSALKARMTANDTRNEVPA